MLSQHSSLTHSSHTETLDAWVDPPALNTVSISTQARAAQAADADTDSFDPRLSLLKIMIEAMTGKRVRVFDMSELRSAAASSATTVNAGPPRAGFGVDYEAHTVYEESQQTSFSASGVIRTADGQEVNFQIDLQMEYHYREESSVSVHAGDQRRKDPLVINFGGTAAQLQSQTFRFDLDNDGQQENVPMLGNGSGYLAIDTNKNGRIDSGKELLGPQTDNGFAELSALDSDKNGWIDESDAAFKDLKIWLPTPDGKGRLLSLQEAGIGALALARVDSPFSLKNGRSDLGAVRQTGLYLKEDGSVGTLQEIDVTV